MKAGVRHAMGKPDKPLRFVTGHARLGLVNTAVRVFGEGSVAVINKGIRYGWLGALPLEMLLQDDPPVEGKPYMVSGIEALIDPKESMSWELPIPDSTSQ